MPGVVFLISIPTANYERELENGKLFTKKNKINLLYNKKKNYSFYLLFYFIYIFRQVKIYYLTKIKKNLHNDEESEIFFYPVSKVVKLGNNIDEQKVIWVSFS